MKKEKITYRVSKAAVGKILAGIITSAGESELDAGTFRALMIAAHEYMKSDPAEMDGDLPEEWVAVKDSIDKAAVRSAKARERAAERHEKKRDTVAKPCPSTDAPIPSSSLIDMNNNIRHIPQSSDDFDYYGNPKPRRYW